MSGAFTPGPWAFDRMESAVEFAALKGETLAEHEGYYRDNNGDWIITKRDADEEFGGRIATATFKGKAKRGETYKAPDPIGQANARLIASAPKLYAELDCREGDLFMLRKAVEAGNPKAELLFRIDDMLRETRAVLAKVRGETA